MATQASDEKWAYEEFLIDEEELLPTDGVYVCSYHLGVVGRYFSVTLGKDLYGQSIGGSELFRHASGMRGVRTLRRRRDGGGHLLLLVGARSRSCWSSDSLRWARDGCVGKPPPA